MNLNERLRRRKLHGFSIVEIIVTMAIIGILTLILVPVVGSRTRTARLRAAEQDLENLANGLERAAIDTGYFFRIYVLDDLGIQGDGIPNNNLNPSLFPPAARDRVDTLADEILNPLHTSNIFIDLNTFQFLANFTNLYTTITADTPFTESTFGWNGPYVNWSRDLNYNDWPDDPWGSDYLFFTRRGALGPLETDFVTSGVRMDLGNNQTRTLPADALVFDRPTVLSLGPDGLPGDGGLNPAGNGDYGTGDDIYRKF
jgi:prepilin-type N-terminal cleavage/methylation domain-containing protein